MKKQKKETEEKIEQVKTKKTQGKIFVLSGPGGAGKTTLVGKLFDNSHIKKDFIKGITVTTRDKREGEEEGKDYFFVTKDEFLRLKKKKFFLEDEKVLDDYYGTPKILYSVAKKKNMNLVLCIDVKGGMYLKKNYKAGRIITIFITAPSQKELYRRMKKRSEDKKVMEERVKLAKEELLFSEQYDFVVTNKNIKSAVKEVEEIITKEEKK